MDLKKMNMTQLDAIYKRPTLDPKTQIVISEHMKKDILCEQ